MDKIFETVLKFLKLDGFIEHITGYVETRIELMKIEIREDMTKAVARGLVATALFLMGFLSLLFLSFATAYSLNALFETPYAGFWIVAGIYGVTFLLMLVFRSTMSAYFERHMSDLFKHGKEKK